MPVWVWAVIAIGVILISVSTNWILKKTSGISKGPSSPGVAPSALTYATNPASYPTGAAISANSPSVTGSPTSYSASPSLPPGLSLDTSTGVITGTPTTTGSPAAGVAQATYVVTASNGAGSTTCNLVVTTTPCYAYGDITIGAGNLSVGDTIGVDKAGFWPVSANRYLTATAATSDNDNFIIGATVAITAANLTARLNAVNGGITHYVASNPSAGVVRITAGTDWPNTTGNSVIPLTQTGGRATFSHVDGSNQLTGGAA